MKFWARTFSENHMISDLTVEDLRDETRTLNIFITANEEDRITRIRERHPHFTEEQARNFMLKADQKRASYYNYYSPGTWGEAKTYDLCINSSLLGLEGTMQFIKQVVVML